MLQITPQMKILVAVEPADFRKGIDGLAALCKESLQQDPFGGAVFVFRWSPGDGGEGAGVRRPGVLAGSQTALPGPLLLVAVGGQRRRQATCRPPAGRLVLGRQPGSHGRGARLASAALHGLSGKTALAWGAAMGLTGALGGRSP